MNWHDRMNRAIDYIEKNLSGEIVMEQAARCCHQSVAGLLRTFSVVTDMSISDYIRKRRLSLAAYELQNSGTKITEIAMKYGYDSPDAFTRAFKELFGLPPSVARDANTTIKPFPRISFYISIKGDVAMDVYDKNSDTQIINMYYERMPACRIIGKRYTFDDLDPGGQGLSRAWNDWFQNGWFNVLFDTGMIPGHEYEAYLVYERKPVKTWSEVSWWIGVPTPAGTAVPEGFIYKDLPAGVLGTCWVRGSRLTEELVTQKTHMKTIAKILAEGNTANTEIAGETCEWSFQRYDSKRFFAQDSDGKVICDHCVYVVESEAIDQAMQDRDKAELFAATETSQEPEAGPRSSPPAPEVRIEGMSPFVTDAQNNMLFCALTSLMLKIGNIGESTPYFCQRINSICNQCKACGDKPNLHRHHSSLYHFLLTITGVAFMVADRNENSKYDLKAIPGILPPQLEDRLDFAMKARGLTYTYPGKNIGEGEVARQILESIRQDKPVLMKFGRGPIWGVITGYNDAAGTIYGLDMRDHFKDDKGLFAEGNMSYTQDGLFALTNWFRYMEKAIIVTGRTDGLGFRDYIERIIGQLKTSDEGIMNVIPRMIDSLTFENAYGIAAFLLQTGQNMMEERWHAHECLSSTLLRETDDPATHDILLQCSRHCINVHDIIWQLWGHLGVGPHTDGKLPNLIGQRMMDPTRQETLKESFCGIWNNDRAILRLLSDVPTNVPESGTQPRP